jgi:L-fuconolactonase
MLDSHAHIISNDCVLYPPLRRGDDRIEAVLSSAFTAEKLLAAMDLGGVEKALIVQRGQIYGFDNSYVCAAAKASNGRLAAVCGIDGRAENCGSVALDWHARGASGFRLMARPDDLDYAWLTGQNAEGAWSAAADFEIPLCVHFFGSNRDKGLVHIFDLLKRFRISNLVIDHLTNASIESATEVGIDELTKRLSDHENVTLKFTSIPLNSLVERDISSAAVLDCYVRLFGEDRLLWGSDITQSAGRYDEMVATGRAAVSGLDTAVQQKLLHDNAKRIYRL